MRNVLLCLQLFLLIGRGAQSVETVDWEEYETGILGTNPQERFRTTSLTIPMVHVNLWNSSCAPGLILLTPHGKRIRSNKALLLNERGDLVWYHEERGSIKSFQVQRYKNEDYLTFWVGDDNFFGHGRGYYKMFDQSYTHVHTINALDGLEGDYHEFTISPNNTAIITAWQKIPWDLTLRGRENGYIWDCLFQEIDIENEKVLFQWRASDHFSFSDMNVNSWADWTGYDWDPWDWFHINSVEKDHKGNFLITARYTNAVSYIDGNTGKPLWHLGGQDNTFLDLSEGNATMFVDPHMARWTGPSTLSLFDNIDHWTLDKKRKQSRGLEIKINEKTGIARVVTAFQHPQMVFGGNEGSIQRLESGNFFLGYGSANVYAEFSPQGKLLCNAHYAPQSIDPHKEQSTIETYRIYKYPWKGQPTELPVVSHVENILYWSWNGATEVAAWQLDVWREHGGRSSKWIEIGVFEHSGFEASHDLPRYGFERYRLTAWDIKKSVLGAWILESDGTVREIALGPTTQGQNTLAGVYMYICGLVIVLLWWVSRRRHSTTWLSLQKRGSKLAD